MPIKHGKEDDKMYVRWGYRGKKYYYDPKVSGSYLIALEKARKQMKAIAINRIKKAQKK